MSMREQTLQEYQQLSTWTWSRYMNRSITYVVEKYIQIVYNTMLFIKSMAIPHHINRFFMPFSLDFDLYDYMFILVT